MASHNVWEEEVTFGATIDTPNKNQSQVQNQNHLAPNVFDTPKSSLTPVVTQDSPSNVNGPSTPFYTTPSAQASLKSLPAGKNYAVTSERDLEAARKEGYVTTNLLASSSQLDLPSGLCPLSAATTQKASFDARTKECTMWPTKQTLREQVQRDRAKRREGRCCGCNTINSYWSSMTKKQRLWFKILVALLIVGIAVGLAVGITVAVHGGYFKGKGQSKTIPDS